MNSEEKLILLDERLKLQQPQCGFGILEICCRNCVMGPCRISPFDGGPKLGVCGANEDTIVARNLLRKIAVGTSAHSDHGRAVAEALIKVARKEAPGYEIKDEFKLIKLALELGIDIKDKKTEEIAEKVGEVCLSQFGNQEGELIFTKRAPLKRQKIWKELGITPRGVDREVVEALHRTHMGTDQDYINLMKQAQRCALSDGWGGSMIATDLTDVLFGTPEPILGQVNFGVLKEDYVNIIVHGHEPLLSEMIVIASEDPELINLAKEKGAKGINIGG
ncbi:MAG: carbon monoxide dehydrogenase, partial [Candidatus Omnitrophica bacterium]|nr:carbon monoxide dehydrogenase [Candidatus Omnitrophota bacterium]